MPRNNPPAASSLRNRNRVSYKHRLRIHQGPLDQDAIFPDEEEEKYRLTNLVAGVDAEDANEHHLQEVLSAAHKHQVFHNNRHTKTSSDKPCTAPQPAFIPTPDSTGIVDNYEELYPQQRWKDPKTYVCSSQNVEESTTNGIADGFNYYLDERDKEWLNKNNQEARGEGTSAQGALSATRLSRSAKAKGKEPESPQHMISEDEFELVMGIFEKVTHDRTEFLHHSLETGMDFPGFADYQDVFSTELSPSIFSLCSIPSSVPVPTILLKMAKLIYPHWKERRLERGGHSIIPGLNFDESDTLNESYICFRRRETKVLRKTRASQVSSSDKLIRLQTELSKSLEIANYILVRETAKKELSVHSQELWEKRLAFADLKRKYPAFNDKADDELLVDKEKPAKKSELARVPGLKLRTNDRGASSRTDLLELPSERVKRIGEQVDTYLAKRKEQDHHWEDQIDNPYQAPRVPYASKLFKYIPHSQSSNSDNTEEDTFPPIPREPRAVRLRYGRGGRRHLDRRNPIASRRPISSLARSSLFELNEHENDDDDDHVPEESEFMKRTEERWRFDVDDMPPPSGSDEQDRVLIDDYNDEYMKLDISLLSEADIVNLMPHPAIDIVDAEGRLQRTVIPFRLGAPTIRRDAPRQIPVTGLPFPYMYPGMNASSTQQQVKNMHLNLLPSGPRVNGVIQASPAPVPVPVPQNPNVNGPNGIHRPAISMPHIDVKKEVIATPAIANGVHTTPRSSGPSLPQPSVPPMPTPQAEPSDENSSTATVQAKHQNVTQQPVSALPNNAFHLGQIPNMTASALINSATFPSHPPQLPTGLSLQQVQTIKSVFAKMPSHDLAALHASRLPGSYMHMGTNGANINMQIPSPATANMSIKLPAARQMPWLNSPVPLPTNGVNNKVEVAQTNGQSVNNNGSTNGISIPATNGSRPSPRNGILVNGQPHPPSLPNVQVSQTPLTNGSHTQSPPRIPMAPNLVMASPPLQQQPVGGTQNGYS